MCWSDRIESVPFTYFPRETGFRRWPIDPLVFYARPYDYDISVIRPYYCHSRVCTRSVCIRIDVRIFTDRPSPPPVIYQARVHTHWRALRTYIVCPAGGGNAHDYRIIVVVIILYAHWARSQLTTSSRATIIIIIKSFSSGIFFFLLWFKHI